MGRAIAGVVVGYLAMFIFIFASFTGLFLVLGTDRTFMPESFQPTPTWILGSMLLSVLAAIIGGWVCRKIAQRMRAVYWLIGLVVILGALMAVAQVFAGGEADAVRDGTLSNMEAMNSAQQPAWVSWLNPIIGAIGVWLGGRRKEGVDENLE